MRVLVIGNKQGRLMGAGYYNTEQKISNGLIRNNHTVHFISDRDEARASNIFGNSKLGRKYINKKFLSVIKNFKPEFIILNHSSMVSTESLMSARADLKNLKIAQVCVDPLFRKVNVEYIKDRARATDATFITTAGAVLSQFSNPGNIVSYIPNLVDRAVESTENFRDENYQFDVFWACHQSKSDDSEHPRISFPLALEEETDISIEYFGINGKEPLIGPRYFCNLLKSRMALNLNHDRDSDEKNPAPAEYLYLYNSDRISQIMGSGLLAISMRVNRLYELFEEGREMAFADSTDELIEVVRKYKRDDEMRRRIAEAGWRRSHEVFNSANVARYIEEVTFRKSLSSNYLWPTRIW